MKTALISAAIALAACPAFAQTAAQTDNSAASSQSIAPPAATKPPVVAAHPAVELDEASGLVAPPPAGKSQVIFFRTGALSGAAVWFKVRENGHLLGKLNNQTYFVAVLDPGPHTFTAATENQTKLRLELDPGETYYVRGTTQIGLLMAEPNLQPSDAALFTQHFTHMKRVRTFTDEDDSDSPADAAKPSDPAQAGKPEAAGAPL